MPHETSTFFEIAESQYTHLFDALPGRQVLLQANPPYYTVVAITPEQLQSLQIKKEQILGKPLFEVFSDASADTTNLRLSLERVVINKAIDRLPVHRNRVIDHRGDIHEMCWKISNSPVFSSEGEVVYIIQSAEDITEQQKSKQTEPEISDIKKAFAIFLHAPMAVALVTGKDYILELANDEAVKILGRGEEIIGKPILDTLPQHEAQSLIEAFDEVRTTGEAFFGNEVPVTTAADKKQEKRYFNLLCQPYFKKDSAEVSGVLIIFDNVTEQVIARRKAEEGEEKYHRLFNSIDQGYCTLEVLFEGDRCVDYRYLETNPAFERQSGLTNVVGKTIRELAPDIEPKWFDYYGSVARTGEPIRLEEESKALNKWFEVYAVKLGRADDNLVGVYFTDITTRKNAEKSIRQRENNLRNTILQAPVAMAILRGPTFVVDVANDAMFELWGRSKEELQNKSIFEALPEAKNQGYEELLTRVFTTGDRFSAQGIPINLPRNSEIKTIYINLLYEAFREVDGTVSGVIGVATDVTEQVLSRMKAEESSKDFQFVTDFMPQMIWITRPDGYHYYYNKQWYDYTGLTYGETQGEGWNTVFHPDDRDRAWSHWRHSLATGDPYEIEYRCRRYDGEYRWVLGRALPLKDETGTILKWFGTCTDIHDQKMQSQLLEQKVQERTSELQLAIQELKRSNANLEEFAHAASHDLKEPVRKIHFFTHMLKEQLSTQISESQARSFNRIENATNRMGNLIDDLLLYSHVTQTPHEKESVDLNKKVQLVLEDLELDIEERRATINVGKLPIVQGYRRQIQQLFQNLISNAIKYSKKDVSPVVEISSDEVEKDGMRYHAISVKDNGIGFEPEYAKKIFQMFARLHGKTEYSGTGVGLSIVKKVVENHNGHITVESRPGEGSTFRVLLPVGKV